MIHDETGTRAVDGPARLSRRGMLAAGAAASATLAVAGCTTYRPGTGAEESGGSGAPVPSGGPASGAGATGGGAALGSASDVPVGGGKVFSAQKVVVTQPQAGAYKAFSSVCTHQGCSVTEVVGGTINCPCHGSKFSVTDGSVTAGPANRPLAAKTVSNNGGTLELA